MCSRRMQWCPKFRYSGVQRWRNTILFCWIWYPGVYGVEESIKFHQTISKFRKMLPKFPQNFNNICHFFFAKLYQTFANCFLTLLWKIFEMFFVPPPYHLNSIKICLRVDYLYRCMDLNLRKEQIPVVLLFDFPSLYNRKLFKVWASIGSRNKLHFFSCSLHIIDYIYT